jgi:hypothetical protein
VLLLSFEYVHGRYMPKLPTMSNEHRSIKAFLTARNAMPNRKKIV